MLTYSLANCARSVLFECMPVLVDLTRFWAALLAIVQVEIRAEA